MNRRLEENRAMIGSPGRQCRKLEAVRIDRSKAMKAFVKQDKTSLVTSVGQ